MITTKQSVLRCIPVLALVIATVGLCLVFPNAAENSETGMVMRLPAKDGVPGTTDDHGGWDEGEMSDAQKELVPVDGKPERRYATCALVGNARSLLKKSHGKDIDAHDAVFRSNVAPTAGSFAADVGHTTTARVCNSNPGQGRGRVYWRR